MKRDPVIDHISPAAVRAFRFMVDNADEWFTAATLTQYTGVSKATIYRRFGNLTAARALVSRQVGGFRQSKLHPGWRATKLGAELHSRSADGGSRGARRPRS